MPDLNLTYNGVEPIDGLNNGKLTFNLEFYSDQNIKMPLDSLGFVNCILYCPQDKDFKHYTKDNVIYLTYDCFFCDKLKLDTVGKMLLYKVPVRFVKTKNQNEIRLDKKNLLEFLKQTSCLECKIIYPRMPGATAFSNSFYIPTKDILNLWINRN